MDKRALRVITYAPVVLLGASALVLLVPATRPIGLWLLAEDRVVEDLTFVAFLAASMIAARLAWIHRHGFQWVGAAYLLLAVAFFGIGMEELSWGQRQLGFETPEWLRDVNRQGEINLHNVGALQGRSEWMRLCAGLAGLVAVAARRIPALARIAAPVVLGSWFVVITAHAVVDVFNDIVPIEPRFDFIMQRTSEMIELEIGLAAVLYGWLNLQRSREVFQNDSKEGER